MGDTRKPAKNAAHTSFPAVPSDWTAAGWDSDGWPAAPAAEPAAQAEPERPQPPESGPRYTISELAAEFGLTLRAIRFYEAKGLLSPAREGQRRIYSKRDRARLSLILRGKRVGLALGDIKELLDLYERRGGRRAQLKAARARFSAHIAELSAQRADLEASIRELTHACRAIDRELARQEKDAQPPEPDIPIIGFAIGPSPHHH